MDPYAAVFIRFNRRSSVKRINQMDNLRVGLKFKAAGEWKKNVRRCGEKRFSALYFQAFDWGASTLECGAISLINIWIHGNTTTTQREQFARKFNHLLPNVSGNNSEYYKILLLLRLKWNEKRFRKARRCAALPYLRSRVLIKRCGEHLRLNSISSTLTATQI